MEIHKMKISTSRSILALVCNFYGLKITISLIGILLSSLVYSQPSMSGKEGFYFILKANNNKITDNAADNLRWVDVYFNMFDKVNYDYFSKDEFKWPDYAKKIATEIYQGKESSDFNKLFSYTGRATFGKYNTELGYFPIQLINNIILASYRLGGLNDFNIGIGQHLNYPDFDLNLKMDIKSAEKLVESHRLDRTIDVKVIYNVVNKIMDNQNKWNEKYLGIYVHKIIFRDGATILGEITPKIDYYDKVNFIRRSKTNNDASTLTVTDSDGNSYKAIIIGNQIWLAENLKTTKFNDGTNIPYVAGNTFSNQTTPAYCWCKDNVDNKNTYGALYNQYVVDSRKLCPLGWHVPADYEWSILKSFLGSDGDKLKEAGTSHWASPNRQASNETGFTALPSGSRQSGSFYGFGEESYWWSSTDLSDWWIRYSDNVISRSKDDKFKGFSVRCVQD